MTLPISTGIDRRLVIWKNARLVLAVSSGTQEDATSVPQVGTVTIVPAAKFVTALAATPPITLSTQPDDVVLDADGTMRAYLVCTDDPDITPRNNWTYSFTLHPTGGGTPFTVTCPVPMTATLDGAGRMVPLDLSGIVTTALTPGVQTTQGLRGVGVRSVTANGTLATVTYTDDSTSTFTLPAGTGGAAASPASYVSVKDFGAKGDGTTDDTAAIQAAINGFPAAGGTVLLPAGVYKLSAALNMRTNLTLRGHGDGATLLNQTSTTANGFQGVDITNLSVRDLRLAGPGTAVGAGIGISLTRSVNAASPGLALDSVTIQQFGGDGLNFSNAIISTLAKMTIRNCGGVGYNLHGVPAGSAGTSVALSACYAVANGAAGFKLDSMVYCSFSGCAADQNPIGYEVNGVNTQGIAFVGCGTEMLSAGGVGWKINGAVAVSLTGCWSYLNPNIAIWVTGNAKAVHVAAFAENTPTAAGVNCLKVDTGCSVTVMGIANTRPNLLAAGTTNVLNDGAGNATFQGYTQMYGGLEVVQDIVGDRNIAIGYGGAGGGLGVLPIANAQAVPATNPGGGGVLFVQGGTLRYRGSSGTVTIIALA